MKVKPTPTSPKARIDNDNMEIEKLYREGFQHIEKPARQPRALFPVLVLAMIFGFLAGIVGELVFNAYLIGEDSPLMRALRGEITSTVQNQMNRERSLQTPTSRTISSVNEGMLGIFEKRNEAGTVQGTYPADVQIGSALILSDDGWAVTTSDVLSSNDKEYVAVAYDRRVLLVKHRISDPSTGLVYFQIDGGNFSVVSLADPFELLPTTPFVVLASNPQQSLQRERSVLIEHTRYLTGNALEDSDLLRRMLLVDDVLSDAFRGGAVIDSKGSVVGVVGSVTKQSTAVFPAYYIRQVLVGLLRDEMIERPSLGIRYLDIASVPGIPEQQRFRHNAGALVTGEGEILAVEPESAAESAGIQSGDVILRVNQEELSELKNLSEIVQGYRPNETVTVTLIRNGEEKAIQVTLEKLIR